MRRIALTVSSALALLAASILAAPVASASSGVLASGSFTLRFDGGSHRTFSFEVDQGPGGQVRGQAQWITRGGDVVHIDINCFIRNGNQALVGGTADAPDRPDVTHTVWAIQDDPDVIGLVAFTGPDDDPQVTCGNLLAWDGEPDISGELADFGVPIQQGNLFLPRAS